MIDTWSELERLPASMAEAVKPRLAATDLEGYLDTDGDRLLASARSAAAFWVGLHVRAFSP